MPAACGSYSTGIRLEPLRWGLQILKPAVPPENNNILFDPTFRKNLPPKQKQMRTTNTTLTGKENNMENNTPASHTQLNRNKTPLWEDWDQETKSSHLQLPGWPLLHWPLSTKCSSPTELRASRNLAFPWIWAWMQAHPPPPCSYVYLQTSLTLQEPTQRPVLPGSFSQLWGLHQKWAIPHFPIPYACFMFLKAQPHLSLLTCLPAAWSWSTPSHKLCCHSH